MSAPVDCLLLVRHGATATTRRAAFPSTTGAEEAAGCEPLDRAAREDAAELGSWVGRGIGPVDRCWSSYARRAVETAAAAGWDAEPWAALAECDFGRWAGRTPAEVHATDPGGLTAWYADPEQAPHGGERLSDVRRRAALVLARAAEAGGVTVAVTSGGLVKAAVVEALALDATAVWRVDVAPASVTELHPASDGWRLVRLNGRPLRGRGAA